MLLCGCVSCPGVHRIESLSEETLASSELLLGNMVGRCIARPRAFGMPVDVTLFAHCADGSAGVGKASARRSCVDAFVILLKSDEPWLLAQEDQLCRGLQELREGSLAQETIKRRRTYVISASRRHLRALICEISTGFSLPGAPSSACSFNFHPRLLPLFLHNVTGYQHWSS